MKRRLVKVGVFLVLGAVINVTVAWTVSVRRGPDVIRYWWLGEGELVHTSGANGQLYVSHAPASTCVLFNRYIDPDRDDPAISNQSPGVPSWAFEALMTAQTDQDRMLRGTGWPVPTMWSEYVWDAARITQINGAIATNMEPWKFGSFPLPRVLPLRPIWPDFALDTAIYAAGVFTLFVAVRGRRRRRQRRRRHGLCEHCSYPVGASSVCTECGKPVKACTA